MAGKGSDFNSAAQEALAGDSSSSSTPAPDIPLGKGSDHRQFPNIKNEHASEPTPILSWGNAYKTPGDMPVGKQVFILPKEDYHNACYMWQVPNGEVVIPGKALYRLPSEKTILNSAFGFMDGDVLEDFGVLVVDSCSDWHEYSRQRSTGNWAVLLSALQASSAANNAGAPAVLLSALQASSAANNAGAPAPVAPEPFWEGVKSVSGWFMLVSNGGEANQKWWSDEANSGKGGAVDKVWGKKFLKSLVPSINTSSADFTTGDYYNQPPATYCSSLVTFSTARGIDSFADVFYPQDRQQLSSFLSQLTKGNIEGNMITINAPDSTFTGSYKVGDFTIDSSTSQLRFYFKEIA